MRLLRTLMLGPLTLAPGVAWAETQFPTVGGGYDSAFVPMCVTTAGADVGAGIAVACGTHGTPAPGSGGSSGPSANTGSQSSIAVPVQDAATGAPIAGTDPPGTPPPSGTGVRGWLGGIYAALTGNLKVVVQSGGATQPVSGTVTDTVTSTAPGETNTAIPTSATPFGTPGAYRAVTVQAQGAEMCVTFGTGTLAVPSGGACAVGMHLAAGQGYTYPPTATPSSQGRAIAAVAGGTLWESVQ